VRSRRVAAAPGELRGIVLFFAFESDAFEQLSGELLRLFLFDIFYSDRRDRDVLEDVQVLEEIESLEHHSDLGAFVTDPSIVQFVELFTSKFVSHEFAVDKQLAGVMLSK